MSGTWKTQDGRTLEVQWMESPHLVNTFNMLIRKKFSPNSSIKKCIGMLIQSSAYGVVKEIERRGLMKLEDHTCTLLLVPKRRETIIELCYMNALFDLSGPYATTYKKEWFLHMQEVIEVLHRDAALGHERAIQIVARATELRLSR